MPTWPATLPSEPVPETIRETPPDLLARTEMDAGPAKVRRRFTAGVRTFEVGYVFSPDEMDIWEAFYENDIDSGAESFTYPHPRKWGADIAVRLAGVPGYKHKGAGYYEVTLKLEQLPS